MILVQLFYRDRDTHERHFVAQSEYDEAGGRSEHDRVFAWVRKQQRRMIDAGANPAEWEVVHWNPDKEVAPSGFMLAVPGTTKIVETIEELT